MQKLLIASLSVFALFLTPHSADACGCFSPPVDPNNYAVNQNAEVIVFEVPGDGTTTAHISIRYNGSPESFAWLLPVPNVPELSLSHSVGIGLIEQATAPRVQVTTNSLCPEQSYRCEFHDPPTDCVGFSTEPPDDDSFAGGADGGLNSPGNFSDASTSGGDPVEVLARAIVGSYDTVTFAASDAMATVAWLQDEGFIVNDTMTPFMQPYLDDGMAFVAAKLLPGSDLSEIRPLAVKYEGDQPMIPLKLTAVAAEPEMPVTAIIYSDTAHQPVGRPIATMDSDRISADGSGRNNYPMVLSRTIDEAGGDAFVQEYLGGAPRAPVSPGNCCGEDDFCGIGGNTVCECPLDAFDAEDCGDGITEGYEMVARLAQTFATVTRLTTRLSPHEMTFDPMFEKVATQPALTGALVLRGNASTLRGCESDVVNTDVYQSVTDLLGCTTTYCGSGQCSAVGNGQVACACDAGFAAREFTDLDGAPSVTCVPDASAVDLRAGGLELASPCQPGACGDGTCLDLGGFAGCACDGGMAARTGAGGVPTCQQVGRVSGTVGAENFSQGLAAVNVCAPVLPTCGEFGWLVEREGVTRPGVACEGRVPTSAMTTAPPAPTCDDVYRGDFRRGLYERPMEPSGGGCAMRQARLPWLALGAFFATGLLGHRRRRRA